jgi:predicted Rossmann fold nucleotide-binding protein DprA/Smf involved in DNA uptake
MVKVAVTGHRPKDLWGYDACEGWDWLRSTLRALLGELGATRALSGMALGVDQEFAQAALDVGVPVVAYVPFEGQDRIWPAASQAAYRALLSRCSELVVVSQSSTRQAFFDRNFAMVQAADVTVAVWSGKQFGGTYHAVQQALTLRKPLVWVDPFARQAWSVGSR